MNGHEDDGEEARHHRHRLSGQIHENTGICTADIADPVFVLTPEALAARDARVAATARADAGAKALEDYADEIEWKRPEVCPCDAPESCCGSEDSCDAMRPTTRVIGAINLRARAATYRAATEDPS